MADTTENIKNLKDNDYYTKRTFVASMANMFVYAVSAVMIPLSLENIRTDLSLSFTEASLFSFVASIEQFIIMILSCFVAAKIGKVKVLKVSLVILSLGVVFFSRSNIFIIAILSYLVVGAGQSFSEAMLTPIVVDLYPKTNASKQILLHAFWPLGIVTVSPIIGYFLSKGVSWRIIFLIMSAIIFLIFFIYPSSKKIKLPKASTDFSDIKKLLSSKLFIIFLTAIAFSAATEGAFTYWISTYVQNVYKGSQFSGAIAATSFAVGMAVGRLGFSRVAKVISLIKIILICSIALLISIFLFNIVGSISLICVVVFFTGLSVAPLWPSIQTYAVQVLKMDATLIMVFLSCSGIPGSSFSVLIVGILTDNFGFKSAFLAVIIFATLLLINIVIIFKKTKNIEKSI